jgi:hypothetical protein
VSKRLRGQPPAAEPSVKRARQLNKNTLDAFQQKQAPFRKGKGLKTLPVQDPVSPELIVQQADLVDTPVQIDSTPSSDAPTSPFAFSSPIKLTKTARSRPIFDPIVEQSIPYIVTIYFIAVIDNVRKETFTKTIDINNPERESLSNLRTFLYLKVVKR